MGGNFSNDTSDAAEASPLRCLVFLSTCMLLILRCRSGALFFTRGVQLVELRMELSGKGAVGVSIYLASL